MRLFFIFTCVLMPNQQLVKSINLRSSRKMEKLQLLKSEDNVQDEQISSFHIACATKNVDAIKELLEKGADINSQTSVSFKCFTKKCSQESKQAIFVPENSTALHIAIMRQKKEIVEILVNMGANIYLENIMGLTPIHLSMLSCDTLNHQDCRAITQLLLKKALVLRESASIYDHSHLQVADDETTNEKLLLIEADIKRVYKVTQPELSHLAQYAPSLLLHNDIRTLSDGAIVSLVKSGADISQQTSDEETPLQHLVRHRGRIPEVLRCIKDKIGHICGAVDVNGTTSLHVACYTFDFEWAKTLLESGADVNAQILSDKNDYFYWKSSTPLNMLIDAIFQHVNEYRERTNDLVKLLIDYKANPLIAGNDGMSAILSAHALALHFNALPPNNTDDFYGINEEYGDVLLPVADMLLKNQPTYQVNPTKYDGFSHFHYACMRNEVDVVEKFLDNGIDIHHTASVSLPGTEFASQDAWDFTPLHFAVYYQSVEVVRLLVERGANVNAVSKDEETPLHIAVKNGPVDLNMLEILLNNGTEMKARMGRKLISEFVYYARNITHEQLKFFRSYGFSMDFKEEYYGLIGMAMKNAKPCDREAIFEELIDFCDIKNAVKNNFNPIASIVYVIQKGELDLSYYLTHIQRLIDMGCNVDQQNEQGETALYKANRDCNLEAVEALLLLGANVNIIDFENCPPIDWHPHSERDRLVSQMLAGHVWKMKIVGLQVHKLCETAMLKIHKKSPMDKNLKRECKDEWKKLSKKYILQKFLKHEWSGIVEYPTMPRIQREYVDQLFADSADLRKKFPHFSGLLTMQYRKALDRLELHEVAMDLLPSVLQVDMPYLCFEKILKYCNSNELKYFVVGHTDMISVDVETQSSIE